MNMTDRTPQLHVWVISNPKSGCGEGKVLLQRIIKLLQTEFGEGVTQLRKASELMSCSDLFFGCDGNSHDHVPGDKDSRLETKPLHPLSSSSLPKRSVGVSANVDKDAMMYYIHHGGMRINIVSTEKVNQGRDIAEYLTRMSVEARLQQCVNNSVNTTVDSTATEGTSKGERKLLHLLVAIGGDGSLCDVVNGMCCGVLQAFRAVVSTSLNSDLASAYDDVDDSSKYYWQLLEEKSILRHFLPPLVYIPAGTGSDFARLKLCCENEKDFVFLLRGICKQLISSSNLPPISQKNVELDEHNLDDGNCISACNPTNSLNAKKKDASFGFVVYEVDVSRVFFPRSGRKYFFINECSLGMSCDVINRCDQYKQNKLLSMTGGTVMFAVASIVSVLKMKPKPFRLVTLADAANLPSNRLITRCIASDVMHPHIIDNNTAFQGVENDLQWVKELARQKAFPAKDPLCSSANYYVYELSKGDISLGKNISGTSNGGGETIVNPFYSNKLSRDAATKEKLRAAIDAADVPGQWVCFPSSTLVFGNGGWFGAGINVTPHANPVDGLLSVTNWVAGFFRFVSHIPSLYSGNHMDWSATTTWTTTRCIIDVDTRESSTSSATKKTSSRSEELMVCCETDGELREQLPAIIEISSVITMLVPQRCPPNNGNAKPKKWCSFS